MRTTTRNLTSFRVAATQAEALRWLARRLDWEDRLLELEVDATRADRGHVPVARAS